MKLPKPVLNQITEKNLDILMQDLPQSLLITGPTGVGISTIANYIASTLGGITFTVLPEKNEKVDIEKGTISVDSIRRLYTQTRSIQTGKLIIVIDYAERMAHQAQNAFLKLLEEPGRDVYFILATHTPSKLLPTVASRMQSIDIRPISSVMSEKFIDKLGVNDLKKRSQLLFMADGLPAELTNLAQNDEYFAKRSEIVRDARDLFQAKIYKKMLIANKYKDDKDQALALLDMSMNILKRSISEKPEISLIAQISSIQSAYERISANGNIRLSLAKLVL